jgi:ring-1,2-phenylacetyl-CoA epoxidase subunit PaaE
MAAPHLHELFVKRVTPDAAGAAVVTLAVPPELREAYDFLPGQFLTLRTRIDGVPIRRSYSICSSRARYARQRELDVGIKPVDGGVFSRWATSELRAGDVLDVMPPEGRFTPRVALARHRVAFCAGSGITPVLSIIASTLEEDPHTRFTLVYGNQRVASIMFNEALQDLKDQYPARLTLIHLLSRQPQEVALFNGRLDEEKVRALLNSLLPTDGIDEAFICGPEGMIDATEKALLAAGLRPERIHTERFFSADTVDTPRLQKPNSSQNAPAALSSTGIALDVVLDGKTHHLAMADADRVLDVALDAGLDLPYSCKGGVCCTCRARVLEGRVQMDKNFTLEQWEIDKGFVLTCQARPLTPRVVISYDER